MADTENSGAALARDELCALAEQIHADVTELVGRTALPPYDGRAYRFDGRAWVELADTSTRPPAEGPRAALDQLAARHWRITGLATQVALWIAERDTAEPGLAAEVARRLAILEDCDGLIREQGAVDQAAAEGDDPDDQAAEEQFRRAWALRDLIALADDLLEDDRWDGQPDAETLAGWRARLDRCCQVLTVRPAITDETEEAGR